MKPVVCRGIRLACASVDQMRFQCRLDASCNDNQRWKSDKCRCECKELIDKGKYDNGFIYNTSMCECD